MGDDIDTINPNNGFSHYLIFSNLTTEQINQQFINNPTPALNAKNLSELVGKITKEGKGVMVRIGPDALELIESQTKEQKERSKDETPESREKNRKEVSDNDLTEMGLTREEFELLNTAFTDPAHIANIIKKLANSDNPEKVAEMLQKMYKHLRPETRQAMFNQMVDNNPVFNEEEKKDLKSR